MGVMTIDCYGLDVGCDEGQFCLRHMNYTQQSSDQQPIQPPADIPLSFCATEQQKAKKYIPMHIESIFFHVSVLLYW